MTELEKIDALFSLAKKHGYRIGNIQVVGDGEHVLLEHLTPLAPDAEEEAFMEARAAKERTKEWLSEGRDLLHVK